MSKTLLAILSSGASILCISHGIVIQMMFYKKVAKEKLTKKDVLFAIFYELLAMTFFGCGITELVNSINNIKNF